MSRGSNVNSRGVTQSGRGLQIGSVSTAATLTWETATDWNNAVSRSATEHEPERDETSIRLGRQNTEDGPLAFYRFHSGSGSTLVDVSGNNNDGSITGASWASAPSPRFAGALSFDGTDDHVDCGSLFSSTDVYEVDFWFNPDSTSNDGKIFDQRNVWFCQWNRFGNQGVNIAIYGDNTTFGSGLSTNTWHHFYGRWEVGTALYGQVNGGAESSYSTTDGVDDATFVTALAANVNSDNTIGGAEFAGDVSEFRFWEGTSTAIGAGGPTLYITSGTLTTATKSFSSAATPDLQNLDYSLNGESITLDVIGSPGTADEEIVSQTLDGASSYTLTWSASHTDFRLKPKPSTATDTVSPQFNRGELVS